MARIRRLATLTCVQRMLVGIGVSMSVSHSFADTLILKNGSIVEGRCLNASDKNATEWQVETEAGVLLHLNRGDVRDFPRPLTAEQKDYAERMSKLKDVDSVDIHRKIVEWCSAPDNGLEALADAHRERIVELDPSDKTAWAALGYLSTEQGWVRRDLYQKRRGLQQKGTRWYIPQDLAIQTASEQTDKLVAQVSQAIAKAVAAAKTTPAKAEEARQILAKHTGPLAVPKITELLEKDRSNSNPQFRLQMVEILGRIRSGGSVKALIASAVNDPDRNVRSECVSKLSEFGSEAAVQSLMLLLTNSKPDKDKPEIYDRVGEALSVLGDERCIEKLLDCLVTDHVMKPPPQPGNQAVQQKNGNVNFAQGQPKPVKIQSKNDGILSALQVISNGETFGFDVQAWRNWYAKKYAAPNPYVSRDP